MAKRKETKHKLEVPLKVDYFSALVISGVSFFIYLLTLCPTVDVGDAGELIAAAYTLGIPHPPGYPLYCILGKLFTFIPIGSIAYRTNMMSAFFAAACAGTVYLILRLKEIRKAASAVSAFLLAFSSMFWSQAVISEVYAMNAFFVSATFFILALWEKTRKTKYLYLFSFFFGLGI